MNDVPKVAVTVISYAALMLIIVVEAMQKENVSAPVCSLIIFIYIAYLNVGRMDK